LEQRTNPIGAPAGGKSTFEIIQLLSELSGSVPITASVEAANEELHSLIKLTETTGRSRGEFPTQDGKAHFVLYSDQTMAVSAEVPQVLESDARMSSRMKLIQP